MKDQVLPFPNLIHRVRSFKREIHLEQYAIFEPQPKEFIPTGRVGQGMVRRKYGDHDFGSSLAQDIKFATSLLTDIATRLGGGEYGELVPHAQPHDDVNTEAAADGSKQDAETDAAAETRSVARKKPAPVDEKLSSSTGDSEPEYGSEGFEEIGSESE